VILEGGYSPHLIAEAALNVMHALLSRPPPKASAGVDVLGAAASTAFPDAISVQDILDAIRRRMNTLSPWKDLAQQYFHESEAGAAASAAAATALTQSIQRSLEEEKGTSYYKQIDGVKYDRGLLEKAEKFAKDGQISFPEAKELWELAQDGRGVTVAEMRTLVYTLQKFKYTDKAANFLRPLINAGKPKSYYKQIDGVKYDRELLDMAEEFAKDGQISGAEAQKLWEAALDGKGVTETERRTLLYTMKKFKYTDPASIYLTPLLSPDR